MSEQVEQKSKQNPILKKIYQLTTWLEYFFAGIYVFVLGWSFFLEPICGQNNCQNLEISNNNFQTFLLSFFIFIAITSCIRIILNSFLQNSADHQDAVVILCLIFCCVSLVLFGAFYDRFNLISQKRLIPGGIFYTQFLSILTAAVLLFTEQKILHHLNFFTKFRLSLTLIILVILTASPGIGLLLSLILIPASVFLPVKVKELHHEN